MRLNILYLVLSALVADVLVVGLAVGGASGPAGRRSVASVERSAEEPAEGYQELWKRKGGGGGGGRGGGGFSGGGSSGGGRGGSGSSGSGGSSGRTSSSSSLGGTTKGGSGPRPQYGGGAFYGGGAKTPYQSGGRSPSGISPFFLGAGLGVAFWPGIWASGAYLYPYHAPYGFHNHTTNKNETKPVLCGCDPKSECGCDENNSTVRELVGDGDYRSLNKSVVNVAQVNGTDTILVNGTLPNGTTANAGAGAFANNPLHLYGAGWWVIAAAVGAMVFA